MDDVQQLAGRWWRRRYRSDWWTRRHTLPTAADREKALALLPVDR